MMAFPKLFALQQKDISRMAQRRDINGLIKALQSSDFAVQTQAAQALGSLGSRCDGQAYRYVKTQQ